MRIACLRLAISHSNVERRSSLVTASSFEAHSPSCSLRSPSDLLESVLLDTSIARVHSWTTVNSQSRTSAADPRGEPLCRERLCSTWSWTGRAEAGFRPLRLSVLTLLPPLYPRSSRVAVRHAVAPRRIQRTQPRPDPVTSSTASPHTDRPSALCLSRHPPVRGRSPRAR